jgi:hypothetical protein
MFFKGHGAQVVDKDADEEDGFDEILIPADYRDNGPIFDDELYHLFITQVQPGVHVVAVIDSCHSGSALDLPYICNVGDEEIHRDEAFKMPIDGTGAAKKRKTKEKKKKKKKDKDPSKKKKKKKKSKDADAEEALMEEEDQEQNYGEEEEAYDDEDEREDANVEVERETEKKKKKKLFGFGKKKK